MSLQSYPNSEAIFEKRINDYFEYIEGEYHAEPKPAGDSKERTAATSKVYDREPQPTTFSDLALFLGFDSLTAFDDYLMNGKYASLLRQANLRVIASYERKLHGQSSAGAIVALKRSGWGERVEQKTGSDTDSTLVKVQILESGPKPAGSEKEVQL